MNIDAVIIWVDGEDEKFVKRKNKFIEKKNIFESTNKTRFNQVNEISIVVKSIFKFASFIRNIYIVTDRQTPKIYQQSKAWSPFYKDRIFVVDHKEVFSDHLNVLPTFNACTIETMLQNINGLSEHFIYFNDDMFLIKPTKKDDWFSNGKPIVRGKWKTQPNNLWYKRVRNFFFPSKLKSFGFNRAQAISAKIAGFEKRYFKTYHTPRALNKLILKDYFNKNKTLLKEQIKFRFRHHSQYLSYSLIWHYSIKNNLLITSEKTMLKEINVKPNTSNIKVINKIKRAIEDKDVLFLNIQSMDLLKAETLKEISVILDDIIKINLYDKSQE